MFTIRLNRTYFKFYRGLTDPKLKPDELDLLVAKYKDPAKPGKVNYMNLHYDIVALGKQTEPVESKISRENTIFLENVRLKIMRFFKNKSTLNDDCQCFGK